MTVIKKGRLGILLLDVAVIGCGLLAKPLAQAMIDYLPDCIFARRGITCPACGGTRSVRELLSGHWQQAFALHPFVFCLWFYLLATGILLNIGYLLPQKNCQNMGKTMISGKAIVILSILYGVFGIVRLFLTLP